MPTVSGISRAPAQSRSPGRSRHQLGRPCGRRLAVCLQLASLDEGDAEETGADHQTTRADVQRTDGRARLAHEDERAADLISAARVLAWRRPLLQVQETRERGLIRRALSSVFVKSFGYRLTETTVNQAWGRPVSESLQGRNPRDIKVRVRRRYGDLSFLIGAALRSFVDGGSVQAGCRAGKRLAELRSAELPGAGMGSGDITMRTCRGAVP
jgi:hypothetical protein